MMRRRGIRSAEHSEEWKLTKKETYVRRTEGKNADNALYRDVT